MSEMMIEVHERELVGKNANRRLRASGDVPAVVYGGGLDPVPIQVNRRAVLDLMRTGSGENTVFLLKLAGGSSERHAMIRDLQVDPISRRILHIDFQRVVMTEVVRVAIPIELEGTPAGVRNDGGLLDFVNREVMVECLPGDIPQHLTLDVEALEIGDHLEAKDLTLPDRVTLVDEPDRVLVSVYHGRMAAELEAEEEAAAEELLEAAPEEPEVIGKGKEEEEEEPES
jgi:large subunit ribosomal protein L25